MPGTAAISSCDGLPEDRHYPHCTLLRRRRPRTPADLEVPWTVQERKDGGHWREWVWNKLRSRLLRSLVLQRREAGVGGGGCAPPAEDRKEIILKTEIFKRGELFRILQMETQTVLLKSEAWDRVYMWKGLCRGRGSCSFSLCRGRGGITGQCWRPHVLCNVLNVWFDT